MLADGDVSNELINNLDDLAELIKIILLNRNVDNDFLKALKRVALKTSSSILQLYNISKKYEAYGIELVEGAERVILLMHELNKEIKRYKGNDFFGSVNETQRIIEIINSVKLNFDSYKTSLNDKLHEFRLEYSDNGKKKELVELQAYEKNLKNIYSQAKGLIDDIYREHKSITANFTKIKLQQEKIDELEDKYRESLTRLSIEEENFTRNRDTLEKGYTIAKDFLSAQKDLDKKISVLDQETKSSIEDIRKLTSFTNGHNVEYEKNKNELKDLIRQTKDILGDATAADVGREFKTQYDSSRRFIMLWPILGAIFLMGSITICILTVFPEVYLKIFGGGGVQHPFDDKHIPYIISRILVAPIFFAGAWFCANQYIKQKNISEDYAYKKVLALSLLSIKTEIEKTGPENTNNFIRDIQKEILRSPLDSLDRKHFNREVKLINDVQSKVISSIASEIKKRKKKGKNNSKQEG